MHFPALVPACLWISLLLAAACPAPSQDPSGKPRPEPLLLWQDEQGQTRPVQSPVQWAPRRAAILTAFESVAGPFPGDSRRCPLDVRVEEEVDCGTHVRQKLTYQAEPGGRVPAYLCIPKAATVHGKKSPAVLCLHPTDNQNGHGVVVGLGGKPNRHYASELAELGFVTLSPSYPLLAQYQPDLDALGYASGTMKAIWDNCRGLDLLDSLPFVRPGRYAAIGHSLGGHNAVYTALFDPRLAVVVSSCGLDSYRDYYGGNPAVWMPEKGWCQKRYMPRMAGFAGHLDRIPFDFHELLAALAPRPVLVSAPLHDSNFRWDSVDRLAEAARPVFGLLGDPGALRVLHPDCPHDFPDPVRGEAYALIRKQLGPPRANESGNPRPPPVRARAF